MSGGIHFVVDNMAVDIRHNPYQVFIENLC